MVDVIYTSGSFEFADGVLATQYVAYVLGRPGDQPWDLQGGSAAIYGLHDQYFFARGYATLGNGSATLSSEPLGAFEDFTMYPETQPDPISGFVLADNSGTLTGIGQTWSRHYRVVVPPKDARFAVPHIRFGSVPAGVSQYLDAHQFEVVPVGQYLPSPFSHARTVQVAVRPARLNYYAGSTHVTDLVPGRTYIASAAISGGSRASYLFTARADGTADLDFEGVDNGDGTSATGKAQVSDNGDGTSTVTQWAPSLVIDNGDSTSTVGVVVSKIMVEEGTILRDYFDGDSGPDYLWEANNLTVSEPGDGTVTVTALNNGASGIDNGNGTVTIASGIDNGDGTATIVATDTSTVIVTPDPLIDNGDGTLTITSGIDNGDGTLTAAVVDNGDGTLAIASVDGTPTRRSYYYPDRQMRHYVLMRNLRQNVALGMTVEDPVYASFPAASSTA